MQLYGFEEMLPPGLQTGPHIFTDCADLCAFGLNGVLSIVGLLKQTLPLLGQRHRSVQRLLWTSRRTFNTIQLCSSQSLSSLNKGLMKKIRFKHICMMITVTSE